MGAAIQQGRESGKLHPVSADRLMAMWRRHDAAGLSVEQFVSRAVQEGLMNKPRRTTEVFHPDEVFV